VLLLACSGAMKEGEPSTLPVVVMLESSASEAMPKSANFAGPALGTMMLPGLTSRWTMPARWATSSAPRTSSPMAAARRGSNGPSERTRSVSVGASTSSITR
jgi:hypothetical protein